MSEAEYYDVLFYMRSGEWGVRVSKIALFTAKDYERDMVDPPDYAKRKPWPKERVKIKRHEPKHNFVAIDPYKKLGKLYPEMLADSKKEQREWDAEADRQCRPMSEILDVVAEVLDSWIPDEVPMKAEEPERPF